MQGLTKSPSCPGGIQIYNYFAPASQVLELQIYTTTSHLHNIFNDSDIHHLR